MSFKWTKMCFSFKNKEMSLSDPKHLNGSAYQLIHPVLWNRYIKNLFPTILQSVWHSCQHPGPQMKLVYFPIYAIFIPPPVFYIGQTDQFPTSFRCHLPPTAVIKLVVLLD